MTIAKARNYNAPMQMCTSFPINAHGRTLLIGIDFDANQLHNMDLHTCASDGTNYCSEGYCIGKSEESIESKKKRLIEAAKIQLEKVLTNLLLPE